MIDLEQGGCSAKKEIDFLKYCGLSKKGLNCNKLPSISFNHNLNKLVLKFYHPSFGTQSFIFDYYDFVYAFQNSQNKRYTPKAEYVPLQCFVQNEKDWVKLVFKFFNLSPTVARQAIHQRKSKKRLIRLKPKQLALDYFGLCSNHSSCHCSSAYNKKKVDQNELDRINQNIQNAIIKAASSFSYTPFDNYLKSCNELNALIGKPQFKSIRSKNKLFQTFVKEVDNRQKELN